MQQRRGFFPETLEHCVVGPLRITNGVPDDYRTAARSETGIDEVCKPLITRFEWPNDLPGLLALVADYFTSYVRPFVLKDREDRIPDVALKFLHLPRFLTGSSSSISGDQCLSTRGWQSSGKEHNRNTERAEPCKCGLQIDLHIGIRSMHFVENDNFSEETEMAHQNMPGLQCCEQNLIDRSNDDGRKS